MHYLDEGDTYSPVILMLHGNPTWSYYYRRLATHFSKKYRVIVPDHLGCGKSDCPADFSYQLEDHIENQRLLLKALNVEEFHLVVHDWGGAIGMGLAVERPERVRSLTIFNTAAFLSSRIPFTIRICKWPGLGALAIRGLNAFAQVALRRCLVRPELLSAEVRRGYLAPYMNWEDRIANLRFVQDIPMDPDHPSYAALTRIDDGIKHFRDHPALIAWGSKDFVFNGGFFDEWRARLPKAEAHYIDDASHYVLEEAHERIIPWMERLLEGAK